SPPLYPPARGRSHLPVRSAQLSTGELRPLATPLRGVGLYLAASFADAKLGRASRTAVRLDRVSCTKCNLTRAHIPPRARSAQAYRKGVPKGAAAPFEMRCIELSSPPVAARLPLLGNEINGRGQGVGSLPYVVFS